MMKVYKIKKVVTKIAKRGKRIIIKNYQNINHTDDVVIIGKNHYVNLIHGKDNHQYNCLITDSSLTHTNVNHKFR